MICYNNIKLLIFSQFFNLQPARENHMCVFKDILGNTKSEIDEMNE